MRPSRFLLTSILPMVAVPSTGARASAVVEVTHTAPVPCLAACANWEPATAAGFDACERPFPPGSFDRSTFRITSDRQIVDVVSEFAVDFDLFLCTDTEPSVEVPSGCLATQKCIEWGCRPTIVLYVGCREVLSVALFDLHQANGGANDRFRVVSMNWLDPGTAHVSLRGPVELVDDSYGALPL